MNLIPLKSIKVQRVLEKTVSRELLSACMEKDRVDNKIKMSVSQFVFFFFFGRKEHERTIQLQTHIFHEKGIMTHRTEPRSQR